MAGHRRESGSGNSRKDLGDCLEEDDDSERGRGVVRGLTRFCYGGSNILKTSEYTRPVRLGVGRIRLWRQNSKE